MTQTTRTISYEVYAYKGGKWVIDSVYDDKQQALHEGRALLESRHLSGVKIIQENYDSETDKTSAMIIFNETKNVEKVKRKPKKEKKSSGGVSTVKAPPRRRNAKKGDFQKSIIKLVLILGGLTLGGVALAAYYMTVLGG